MATVRDYQRICVFHCILHLMFPTHFYYLRHSRELLQGNIKINWHAKG